MARPTRLSRVQEIMKCLCRTSIVTRKDGVELHNAHMVGLLQAAKCCIVEVGGIVRVAVAICDNAAIYTRCVAVPNVDVDGIHRFASCNVNDLHVKS